MSRKTNDTEKVSQFLELHQDKMETIGFWDEVFKTQLISRMETMYKTYIIRDWEISDIALSGDKVLLKWNKRVFPLSDEELKDQYGR